MNESRTIVLVGHCGPDMHLLKSAVGRSLPGAKIVVANDQETLETLATPQSLLLINRVLDGDFKFDHGVEMIEHWRQGAHPPAMMLISNYPEAQDQAIKAGAHPGFGKAQLYDQSTARLLNDAAQMKRPHKSE